VTFGTHLDTNHMPIVTGYPVNRVGQPLPVSIVGVRLAPRSAHGYGATASAVPGATGQRHERALLYRFAHHPTMQQTLRIRSMFAVARVAAPTVEAERNVSSPPVSEAVSEVRPPGGGFCVPGIAPGHGASPAPQRERDQRHSQDCAAGRDLHSGDTPRIQHHESPAVSTVQNPGGLGQRGDHVVDDLAFAARIAILVRDIHAVTAD
jgi:hypothetical protein